MKKNYIPKEAEEAIYAHWENSNFFKAIPDKSKEPFCIMIPPPNVTGTLHMGHGFQNTLMDALIRYKRMSGFDVLWQVGVDHAGIATQMVVERPLESEGKTKEEIGREQFEKKRRGKGINFKEKEKILRFLAYRGFSYEIIKNAQKDYD